MQREIESSSRNYLTTFEVLVGKQLEKLQLFA